MYRCTRLYSCMLALTHMHNNIIYTYTCTRGYFIYRIGRGGLDSRACRPLFFLFLFLFYFFRLYTCVLFAARSRGNRCNNKYPLCGCHTRLSDSARGEGEGAGLLQCATVAAVAILYRVAPHRKLTPAAIGPPPQLVPICMCVYIHYVHV